jgi:hypothetical protein
MATRRRVPVGDGGRVRLPDLSSEEGTAGTEEIEAEPCTCPRLDRTDWHEVESDWSDITFVETGTTALMGVPVGFGGMQDELTGKAGKLGATAPDDAMLLIGPGRFRRRVLLEVEGVSPGAKGVTAPGGVAYSRLVAAPWGEMQREMDATKAEAREKYGRDPDTTWVWYLTCRQCSSEREYETLFIAHYRDVR